MRDRRPKVSIGVPVYNGERFLAEAFDSILAQTFQDFEVIISDNSSTDRTAEICRDYVARDARFRYYRNAANLGASKNFARVFALASGEYFKWWAADDLYAPNFLEECVGALERDPTVVLAHSMAHCIDEGGNVLHSYERAIRRGPWSANTPTRFRQLADEFLFSGGVTAPIYVHGLIRPRALRHTRLLANYIASDWILLLELALQGQFAEVAGFATFLRAHPGSSSLGEHKDRPDKVQEFYDPQVTGRLRLMISLCRRYFEHFAVLIRAPIPRRDKASLLAYVAGTMLHRVRRRLGEALAVPNTS